MDQALRSALDKYNGKQPSLSPSTKYDVTNVFSLIAFVVLFVCAFGFCVKYEYLGMDVVWEKINSIEVGDQTVKEVIADITENVQQVFSKEEYQAQETASFSIGQMVVNNLKVAGNDI